jgi:hypothetical protein
MLFCKRLPLVPCLAFWTAVGLGQPGLGQDISGSISGTVVDDQGQVLPGAAVTLVHQRTGLARTGVTDGQGEFQFNALAPGSYSYRIELPSFRTLAAKGIVLSASDRLSLGKLKLVVGLGESIVVESRGTRVNAEDSQHSGLLTSTQIEQIQTRGRDPLSLLRLVPGVTYTDDIDSLGESFGSSMPNIGGQRQHWNHVTVDGVMGNEIGGSDRVAQAINLDAIDEIKVLLNTYRAEMGRSGGAYVQIVTKGGGSDYDGSAYYYGRHEKLNANSFFNNLNGRPKPEYRYNTFGFRFGGPLEIPGLYRQSGEKKLFFLYSMEAPLTKPPGAFRNFIMPTELERAGDFSQTFDRQGRLIVIYDPVTRLPFPGNRIPANRINSSGRALLDLMPLPNAAERWRSDGYNFTRQESTPKPKINNILRLDYRPNPQDSFNLSIKDWRSDQQGTEITAGPARWGLVDTHYLSTDRTLSVGHTRLFGGLINEFQAGIRQQTEQFQPVRESDWQRLRRSDVGFTAGQFHPEANPQGVIPRALFGGGNNTNGPSPNIYFDSRLLERGEAWVHSLRDNLTLTKGKHTFKGGLYFEHLFNTEGNIGNASMGQFDFSRNVNNPFETCIGTTGTAQHCSFANALAGVFNSYTEADKNLTVKGHGWLLEWYLQDSWKAGRRLTVDYGVRFLWYTPWYASNQQAAAFSLERYDPARAPLLYRPARVGNQNFAQDPRTGALHPESLVGSFIPGTGDPDNGMVLAADRTYPRGFRDNQGVQPEPRLGFAYDLFGNGKTALHLSTGLFHQSRLVHNALTELGGNAPIVNRPTFNFGTLDTLLNSSGFAERPRGVAGFERDSKTPSSFALSFGVQQELGWGTVIDVTYVGTLGRHLEQVVNINQVPDGARFLDLHPENRDPRRTNAALPAEFLRPYRGYQDINIRSHFGTSNYNALQVQLNRRYIKGLQFSVAYTLSRALGIADKDPVGSTGADGRIEPQRPLKLWHYGPLEYSQTHNLVVDYTWDLPKASRLWNNRMIRLIFDDWQLSGENALVSGRWEGVDFSTADGFDFDGGDGPTRPRIVGPVLPPSDLRDPTPGGDPSHRSLDPAAFARPMGRGDYGNAPRNVFRQPGVNNWNLSFFKNFRLGGPRKLQVRWEMYNVLNHTQFSSLNNDVALDAAGNFTNPSFGKATGARSPRVMQGSIRLDF